MRAHALASTPPPLPPPSDNKQGSASDEAGAPYDDSGPAAVVSLSTQGRQLMGLFGANTVAPLAVTGPAAPSGEEQTPSGLALGVAKDQASEAELYAMLQDARVAEAAPREAKPQLNEMTEDEQRYLCLLYTSPSPRDS